MHFTGLEFFLSELVFVFIVLVVQPFNCAQRLLDVDWTHQITLNENFQLKWTTEDSNWITIEMSSTTKGYLGIGISPHGGMAGSDIALGWVNPDGTAYFRDYHAMRNGAPLEDSHQDYELIYALEDSMGTKIVFRRKYDTCDDDDHPINDATLRLIWAWHPSDPPSNRSLLWHGPGVNRGTRSINFFTPGKTIKFPDSEGSGVNKTDFWDVTLYNVRVPKVQTYYHCQIFKFPRVDVKQHIMGYRPLLDGGNGEFIRHISLYLCQIPVQYGNAPDYFQRYILDPGENCLNDHTPKYWIQFCSTAYMTYSRGSEGFLLPDKVGIPIETNEQLYFRLEIEYDNGRQADFLDSSGFRIFYTPKLKKFEAGRFVVGHRRTPFMTIPPSQPDFSISGYCNTECTKLGISPRGIRIFSVLLSAHAIGRKFAFRHIRQGQELPIIAQNKYYDFKYQEYVSLPKEIEFLPGDELLLECGYDSSDRRRLTFGGASFEDELCEATILYYPKTTLSDCRSQVEFDSYLNALGIGNISGRFLDRLTRPLSLSSRQLGQSVLPLPDDDDIIFMENFGLNSADILDTLYITKPESLHGLSLLRYLNGQKWTEDNFSQDLNSLWRNGLQYVFCVTTDERFSRLQLYTEHIPKYQQLKTEARKCEWSYQRNDQVSNMIQTNSIKLTLTVFFSSFVNKYSF